MREAAIEGKEMISKGVGQATKKAQEISSVIQESVGPSLSRASKELPGAVQKIPGAIKGAAGGAKDAAISYWGWVKNEVGGRRK